MKKILIAILSAASLMMYSCNEDQLELVPPYNDFLSLELENEAQMKNFLNSAYLNLSSTALYGANFFFYGDLLGDTFFRSNTNSGGLTELVTHNFGPSNLGDANFYRSAYNVIQSANVVAENTNLPESSQVLAYKAEARGVRAMTYFNLLSYYSSYPASNQHQEAGVPIAVYPYNPDEQLGRSSVQEVFDLIVSDLNFAIQYAPDRPSSKVYLSKTAAKLFLSRVYLTRQNPGDAQLAYNLSKEVIESLPEGFAHITKDQYEQYFISPDITISENSPETVFEMDINSLNIAGPNNALAVYYSRTGARRGVLAKKTFFDSFPSTDVRKTLFVTNAQGVPTGAPATDEPQGVWMEKYERANSEGNYLRNPRVLRLSEAYLNQIEAAYQLGNSSEALTLLNTFATSRGGNTYTGANLLNDILTERNKEFFGEGQRFLDLKRYNLAIEKGTNCPDNCSIPANSKLFVFPLPVTMFATNRIITQHPLWQ